MFRRDHEFMEVLRKTLGTLGTLAFARIPCLALRPFYTSLPWAPLGTVAALRKTCSFALLGIPKQKRALGHQNRLRTVPRVCQAVATHSIHVVSRVVLHV